MKYWGKRTASKRVGIYRILLSALCIGRTGDWWI